MTLEANLADLRRHADDFARRTGFTFTFTFTVARWLATDWPWERLDRRGR